MTTRGRSPRGAESAGGARHIPVLLPEVLAALAAADGERYIDATFGAGGYTRALLDAAACRVLALDRDPSAVVSEFATTMAALDGLTPDAPARLALITAPFSILATWAETQADTHVGQFDGVVFDLGVSSMQLDEAERGFSFQTDGPLDMRMSAAGALGRDSGPSAADLVNTLPAEAIADIVYHYGEERRSRAVARAIVAARAQAPITRTLRLAEVVAKALGGRSEPGRHPATRTFLALRIAVNDELGELARGLSGAELLLRPGGRLVVVTFHSLEDRIVKRFLAERAGKGGSGSRHLPENKQLRRPSFRLVNPRPLAPGHEEIDANPRARSAKLRAAVRTDAAPWPLDAGQLGVPVLDPTSR